MIQPSMINNAARYILGLVVRCKKFAIGPCALPSNGHKS